jgi:hypothetical protein
MTANDANAARKALLALDDRTPQQRLLGEPPTWRSALAQETGNFGADAAVLLPSSA